MCCDVDLLIRFSPTLFPNVIYFNGSVQNFVLYYDYNSISNLKI